MRDDATLAAEAAVWGPYPSYDDVARFDYGRRLWRLPEMRRRLLAHWLDERHPHRERFLEHRELIESVLASEDSVPALDARLRESGASLRCVAREIPVVFGEWFSKQVLTSLNKVKYETKKISARLPLLAVAFCTAFAGCATHERGSYVIVRMDYDGVVSALRTRDGARIYIRDVKPGAERDMLLVRYTRLEVGDKSEWTAGISKEGITITPITQTSTIEQNSSHEARSDVVSVMELPWVAHYYDEHPETGRMLLRENRVFLCHGATSTTLPLAQKGKWVSPPS